MVLLQQTCCSEVQKTGKATSCKCEPVLLTALLGATKQDRRRPALKTCVSTRLDVTYWTPGTESRKQRDLGRCTRSNRVYLIGYISVPVDCPAIITASARRGDGLICGKQRDTERPPKGQKALTIPQLRLQSNQNLRV